MFINKAADGSNNICGKNISLIRKNMNISQRKLADLMQLSGLDVDKNAIQRIEAGKRFITDIELAAFAVVFKIEINKLFLSSSELENFVLKS